MIPYPCWLPSASAVRIRNVASCIARSVIHTLYTVGLAVARPPELPRRWAGQAARRERRCLDHDQAVSGRASSPCFGPSALQQPHLGVPGRCRCGLGRRHRREGDPTTPAGAPDSSVAEFDREPPVRSVAEAFLGAREVTATK